MDEFAARKERKKYREQERETEMMVICIQNRYFMGGNDRRTLWLLIKAIVFSILSTFRELCCSPSFMSLIWDNGEPSSDMRYSNSYSFPLVTLHIRDERKTQDLSSFLVKFYAPFIFLTTNCILSKGNFAHLTFMLPFLFLFVSLSLSHLLS